MIGVYYSIKLNTFAIFPGMAVPVLVDQEPLSASKEPGVEYRLVTRDLLCQMERQIASCMASRPREVGAWILQFYRVRTCIETHGMSENIDHERRYGIF